DYEDIYIVRTDSDGDSLWTSTIGGYYSDEGWDVKQTEDKGFIITGTTVESGDDKVLLLKTDSLGDSLWAKDFGAGRGYSLDFTYDGGYIIVGYREVSGYDDIYLIKTDSSGDLMWSGTFGGAQNDRGYSVQQTADSGYVIAGQTNSSGAGNDDCYIVKVAKDGDFLWSKTVGGDLNDNGWSVKTTNDGYIIAGTAYSFGGGSDADVYLVKLSPQSGIEGKRRTEALKISCVAPNPSANTIILEYKLPEKTNVEITVYNMLGQEIEELYSGNGPAGVHTIKWDCKKDTGKKLPSGIYFVEIKAGMDKAVEKLMLLR
ncbi:MAG: T9SS type A sorting domain-containing protein, partial [Promethearchaeota archaeon]